jgi:SsrA-binding protein
MNKEKTQDKRIVVNKKAMHDFFIEERSEAGMVLEGWEVKSLRAGQVQLRDSYVILKRGEAFLIGVVITPLSTAATYTKPDSQRTRKLLLHEAELKKFIGLIERKGYTLVALSLYWKNGKVKCEVGLAKGKKQHDKRETLKQRDWEREQGRALKR